MSRKRICQKLKPSFQSLYVRLDEGDLTTAQLSVRCKNKSSLKKIIKSSRISNYLHNFSYTKFTTQLKLTHARQDLTNNQEKKQMREGKKPQETQILRLKDIKFNIIIDVQSLNDKMRILAGN